MQKGGITISFAEQPTQLESAYVLSALEYVQNEQPELDRYLKEINIRLRSKEPRNFARLDERQRSVLRFLNIGGRYTFDYGPIAPGVISLDYLPSVDVLTAVVLHELAHVLDRIDDPEFANRNKRRGRRNQWHNANWSGHACRLYQAFGCQQAALFLDGMNYRSTRLRHAALMPEFAGWANRIWATMDSGQCGDLHDEFADLFHI